MLLTDRGKCPAPYSKDNHGYPNSTTSMYCNCPYLNPIPCYLVIEIYHRLSLYYPSQVSFCLSQLPVHKSREQISTDSLSNVYLLNF